MDPITVEVRRGNVVESRHTVHAIATSGGRVLAEAGDSALVSYLRSSAKPFQALPLVRERDDLTDEEIAIASASHLARPEQLAAVRSLLAKAPAEESELECGPGTDAARAQLLGQARRHAGALPDEGLGERGLPARHASGPARVSRRDRRAAGVRGDDLPTAVDGCGVLTFALPLDRMASMFAGLEQREGGARVAAAMRAHPELIRGPTAADTLLMRELEGWTAKGGAEGLLCAAGPDGLGIALKVEDGNMRAMRPALAELLRRLGFETGELGVEPVENSLGELVGEVISISSRTSLKSGSHTAAIPLYYPGLDGQSRRPPALRVF